MPFYSLLQVILYGSSRSSIIIESTDPLLCYNNILHRNLSPTKSLTKFKLRNNYLVQAIFIAFNFYFNVLMRRVGGRHVWREDPILFG